MTSHTKPSQTAQVLAYILKHGSITQAECTKHIKCTRLAARVKELRDDDHDIVTHFEGKGRNKYARYSLATPVQLALL